MNILRIFLVVLVAGCLPQAGTSAQILTDIPENAKGIDVVDQVGQFIPLDLPFNDSDGNPVMLGRYFKRGKPIILTLNYSNCPGLCVAQLDNLVSTLREMDSEGMGTDFEIVTVSIDPGEKPVRAAQTKEKYVRMLDTAEAREGWHFLTGRTKNIKKLADAVGFKYTYDKAAKRYNHPAATYFISPDGRICRYFLSLGVEPKQLKLAVAEAGRGVLSPPLADRFIQFCYLYDPDANRYSADARRLMAVGGAAFVILITGTIAPFGFTRKLQPAAKEPSPDNEDSTDGEITP